MIDGSEKKFITSLLNRDKRTIILNRARSVTSDNNEILFTLPEEVKTEATNVFSNQFRKRNHKFDKLLSEHWEQEYLSKQDIDPKIYRILANSPTL